MGTWCGCLPFRAYSEVVVRTFRQWIALNFGIALLRP